MIKISVKNIDATVKNIKTATAKVISIVDNELVGFAEDVVTDAKRLAPTDQGKLKNSINFDKSGLKLSINVMADYAAYVEFGTRKFAAKYVSTLPSDWQTFASQYKGKGGGSFEEFVMNLVRWVKDKGIGATYSVKTHRRDRVGKQTAQQTIEADAYAIALYIMRNGTQAHPFLVPAVEKNKIELLKNLKGIIK